jgi:hypothetical protein
MAALRLPWPRWTAATMTELDDDDVRGGAKAAVNEVDGGAAAMAKLHGIMF